MKLITYLGAVFFVGSGMTFGCSTGGSTEKNQSVVRSSQSLSAASVMRELPAGATTIAVTSEAGQFDVAGGIFILEPSVNSGPDVSLSFSGKLRGTEPGSLSVSIPLSKDGQVLREFTLGVPNDLSGGTPSLMSYPVGGERIMRVVKNIQATVYTDQVFEAVFYLGERILETGIEALDPAKGNHTVRILGQLGVTCSVLQHGALPRAVEGTESARRVISDASFSTAFCRSAVRALALEPIIEQPFGEFSPHPDVLFAPPTVQTGILHFAMETGNE